MNIKIFNENVWGCEVVGNRTRLTAEMIREYDADICGFQECSPNFIRVGEADIALHMGEEYAEVPTLAGKNNYTPVFYKKDRFNLIDGGWELYTGKNDVNSKSYTWCLLEDKEEKTRFVYISTHFWWMWDSEEDDIQRLANVDEIYAFMQKVKEKYDVPVIFAGDLNSGENSDQGENPIKKLYDIGLINLKDIAEISDGHFTHHDYPVIDANGIYYGNFQPVRTLDHAFMLPDGRVKVKKYIIDSSEKALSATDHCPIKIDIEIE